MTDQRELDRLLGAYFVEGTNELADRVIDAALDQIDHTQQRRAMRAPWRFQTMTSPMRLATAALIGVLAVGGALYLSRPDQSTVGGPVPSAGASPSPSELAVVGPSAAPTPQVPATSGVAGGGSGSAHYEITGPDAASGDAKFASSIRDTSSDAFSQSVRFQDGSLVIRIKFPGPGCVISGIGQGSDCGTVDISTATVSLHDGGPSCTWDIAPLTANDGAGTVECINAVNPAHATTPNRVTITFTYHDPSAG
jgi:hypothetical protein